MSHLSPNDMVFYKEVDENTNEQKIMSGGFSIESLLLNRGESPMYTSNTSTISTGGSVSSIFKNLAVPAGLLYQKNASKKRNLFQYSEDVQEFEGGFKDNAVLSEDIHSQLIKMIEVNDSGKTNNERKTRKHRISREKKNSSRRS